MTHTHDKPHYIFILQAAMYRNVCLAMAGSILLLLSTSLSCQAQPVDSAKVINGLSRCWHAFSHEYATIYGLDEDEIKRYSKQRVCIGPDSLSLYYGASYHPRFAIKKVHANSYAKANFDCDQQRVGIIADSMYEVTITSTTAAAPGGKASKTTDVIAFDGTCSYIVLDGVVFKLVDADSKVQPRSSQ